MGFGDRKGTQSRLEVAGGAAWEGCVGTICKWDDSESDVRGSDGILACVFMVEARRPDPLTSVGFPSTYAG